MLPEQLLYPSREARASVRSISREWIRFSPATIHPDTRCDSKLAKPLISEPSPKAFQIGFTCYPDLGPGREILGTARLVARIERR